jgi:predicted DCC family thiol-disulfide oxidoreductase YuxK
VEWLDVSRDETALPAGLDRRAVLRRFHVRRADGRVIDGARAFLALWAVMPRWRWLSRFGRLPGMPWVLEGAYRAFLPLRPRLQRLALARQRRRERSAPGESRA